ncbi:MAG TPA: MBOAT family O-acyltransferase [Bryobacteraceae bacterium]|jgi:alginate O-acetyltransferase complex protein AlgI|nr:MBOAT family O-acyltransferase [Bryobacteraceae bacterium]
MLFNSEVFLFLFLPVAYWVFWLLRARKQRYIWLTITGYAFYAGWNWKFCFLMLFSTLVSYTAGRLFLMPGWTPRQRKWILGIPVTVDLLLLGFFKYADFTLQSFSSLLSFTGHPVHVPHLNIVLPIGISFYTFHTISYVVDSYRGNITPTADLWEFASYVSLFSQLVAGPIVRFRQIEGDLENLGTASRGALDSIGWSYFVIGLSQKLLIADLIAAIIDPALANFWPLGTVTTWACMLGYTYQLYFDFAGYSNMAVGLGYLFGIRIPQNFNTPYKADGIADFWRRWHISLSSCLRDYIYIPLGGSRDGTGATYRNLMYTMLIGGLWHGANWTFVVWGAYHGILLCLNRIFDDQWRRIWRPARLAITFLLVVIGWVFFRSRDFRMAAHLLRNMFAWVPSGNILASETLAGLLLVAFAFAHFGRNTFEMNHKWSFGMTCVWVSLFGVCLLRIVTSNGSPFLYFQF